MTNLTQIEITTDERRDDEIAVECNELNFRFLLMLLPSLSLSLSFSLLELSSKSSSTIFLSHSLSLPVFALFSLTILKNHSCVIDCHGFNCIHDDEEMNNIKKCTADFTPQKRECVIQCQELQVRAYGSGVDGWQLRGDSCWRGKRRRGKWHNEFKQRIILYEMWHPYIIANAHIIVVEASERKKKFRDY